MSPSCFRRFSRRLLAAAFVFATPAFAADKPATASGAEDLRSLFAKVLPAAEAGLITVKADSGSYAITVDLAGLNSVFRAAGATVAYDPATLSFRASQQDDGKWRVTQNSLPKITTHAGEVTTSADIVNYRQTLLIDPSLAWWVDGAATADKGAIAVSGPQFVESLEFGMAKADYATTAKGDGTVSTAIKEEIHDIDVRILAAAKGGDPANVSGRVDKAAFNVGADGLKTKKLFDLWMLLAAGRENLVAHEGELKRLLHELAAPGFKFVEGGEASKAMVSSSVGSVALSGVKAALGVANAGAQSAIDATISVEGLSLPVGLMPPGAADLTPSKIDITAALKGIDISAAANEAIDGLKVEKEGLTISDEAGAKVMTALLGAGPIRIELAPSHLVAPAVDADFEGAVRYMVGKASGTVTIRARNFDKTMAAVKTLGPDVQLKAIPALAMVKGLAKTDSDGSLSWAIELGEDRSIKVNGIPFGKAPG